MHEWELRLLRAAGALRVFSVAYKSMEIANELCIALQLTDADLPFSPPTNNPDGWNAYRKIFRDLQSECQPSALAPLLFSQEDPGPHPEDIIQFEAAIPDMSRGTTSLEDILAALEWQTHLLPLVQDAHCGDVILIDLRGLMQEVWKTSHELSLLRGITALRNLDRPIWFIQYAGQRVEDWGLLNDHPIFTQYSTRQFSWMMEVGPGSQWPVYYAERCGLHMCEELREKCRSTNLKPG